MGVGPQVGKGGSGTGRPSGGTLDVLLSILGLLESGRKGRERSSLPGDLVQQDLEPLGTGTASEPLC
jgi:hypothetical protein